MKRDFGAVLYFVVITLWLTWPLVALMSEGLSGNPDALLNAWALGWNFHVLPQPVGYFDANIFAPRPDTLAYSEHLSGIAAITWPFYVATGNLVFAYNAAVLLSFVLAGVGMYLLARDLTGNRWAALAAGTVFLAAPYRFLHVLHIQLLTFQWFPFVLWCLLRFLRGGGVGWVGGVVVFSLLQILSCNYYAVYLAFAMVVLGAVLLAFGRALLNQRRTVALAVGALAVAAVSLPFFAPYERNRDRGFYRRYEDVVQFSAAPSDYFRPSSFNDAPHWGWLPRQQRSEKALFPGFVALALAAVGAMAGYRLTRDDAARRVMWIFVLVVSAAAVVLSLGPELRVGESSVALPYRFFYRYVPGFNGMRVPARMSVLALLGGAALVAWGGARLRLGNITGPCVLVLLLFDYQTSSLARVLPAAPSIPAVHQALASMTEPGAVLVLPIHEGEEIGKESLYMYYSTVHWRPLVNGFSGWWPNDYWELVGRLRAFPTSRSLRFLLERAPVRYVVIHYDKIPEPARRQLEEAMDRYRERMPLRVRIDDAAIYEIVTESDAPL